MYIQGFLGLEPQALQPKPEGLGFRVRRFGALDLAVWAQGLRFGVSGFSVKGLRSRVWSLGF